MQRHMLHTGGIQEQVSTAIRAKEISRSRGKRKSTLYGRVLVSTRLHVPDHTELLKVAASCVALVSHNGLFANL